MANLSKVNPGDVLNIPASAYNAFVDAAAAHQQRQFNVGGAPRSNFRQTGIVSVRNDTGAVCPRFGVLGISGPLIWPSDDADAFKERVVLTGTTPTAAHVGRFVVTLEPIPIGGIGRAFVDGVCVARVTIDSELHACADVSAGVVASLKSCAVGSARMLWVQDAEHRSGSVAWCVVQLGPAVNGPIHVQCKCDGGSAGNATTACTYTYAIFTEGAPELTADYRLAEELTPQYGRTSVGQFVAADDGSLGLASYIAGEWKLWFVGGERPPTKKCEVTES
ncbi:MAG: hypothetical protein PVJ57_17790 [Phycisphaerae bacterium]